MILQSLTKLCTMVFFLLCYPYSIFLWSGSGDAVLEALPTFQGLFGIQILSCRVGSEVSVYYAVPKNKNDTAHLDRWISSDIRDLS